MFHRHPLRPEAVSTSSLGNSFDVTDPEDELDQRLKDIKAIKIKVSSCRWPLSSLHTKQELFGVYWTFFLSFLRFSRIWAHQQVNRKPATLKGDRTGQQTLPWMSLMRIYEVKILKNAEWLKTLKRNWVKIFTSRHCRWNIPTHCHVLMTRIKR